MKTKLVGAFLLMNAAFCYSQTYVPFPPPGMVQGEIRHGDWTAPGEFDATITRVSDTVIAGVTYNRFIADTYPNTFWTRYDNGKIYEVHTTGGTPTAETMLYDFTLTIGQTFMHPQLYNPVVDSVSTITLLNGEVRKYMRLTSMYGSNIWVDGIGDINRGFTYYHDFEGGHMDFVCLTDATGLIWLNNDVPYDCDSLTSYTTAGISNSEKTVLSIYPNPADDLFYLQGDFNNQPSVELHITDLSGKVIIANPNFPVSDAIQVSDLAPGVYVITVFDGVNVSATRLLKH